MKETELPVCNIGLFGDDVRNFCMNDLSGLFEKFPVFEFPHKQDFYTLIIVEDAEGEIVIDNHKIRLNYPKAIIIKPGCVSSIDINRKAKGTLICFTEVFFSLRYNNNILSQFSFLQREAKPYIRLNNEKKKKCDVLIKLLFEEYSLKKRESDKVLRSYLNIVLFELERLYNPTGFLKSKNLKREKVHEFELLIDQYFSTKKLPSSYASLLNVSPNYLNKICKEETGQTAGDLIRKRITIEAKRFMYYTNYNINEIANKLGFENTSYFVTFFKKQTATTPEQFRKNNS
ncbi:MAG: AraC family transcriptional regulator [Sphingobacteriales bacterium]|nr:AraC family transcriptional regulator [Sphingobacteriales bacterium]